MLSAGGGKAETEQNTTEMRKGEDTWEGCAVRPVLVTEEPKGY